MQEYVKGWHCRSGNVGTMWQGWTLQQRTYQHGMATVDNAGVDKTQEWAVASTPGGARGAIAPPIKIYLGVSIFSPPQSFS